MKREKRMVEDKEVPFRCLECGIVEDIPKEAVDYFHEMDGGDKNVPPRFQCEKCGGIMEPIQYTTDDGITYSLKE